MWAERVERDGHGMVQQSPLEQLEHAREMLLMGLRLTEGIDAARFADRTGVSLGDAIDQDVLQQALGENYLAWQAEPPDGITGGSAAPGRATRGAGSLKLSVGD